jgi:hypothetical protein
MRAMLLAGLWTRKVQHVCSSCILSHQLPHTCDVLLQMRNQEDHPQQKCMAVRSVYCFSPAHVVAHLSLPLQAQLH